MGKRIRIECWGGTTITNLDDQERRIKNLIRIRHSRTLIHIFGRFDQPQKESKGLVE